MKSNYIVRNRIIIRELYCFKKKEVIYVVRWAWERFEKRLLEFIIYRLLGILESESFNGIVGVEV